MLASILVGNRNPWVHPYFKAFKDGFNCIAGRRLLEVRFWILWLKSISINNARPFVRSLTYPSMAIGTFNAS